MSIPRRERLERLARARENAAGSARPPRRLAEPNTPRPVQRLTAAAVAASFFAFLLALGLFVVTGPGTAERIIARALPPLTQVDRLLALHVDDLQAAAKAPGAKQLRLSGFPVDVTLTPSEASGDSSQRLQLLLDTRAARAIYERGTAAFSASGNRSAGEPGSMFSSTWTLQKMFSLLNARTHARVAAATFALAVLTLALACLFCLQVWGYGRLVGLAIAGVFGSLIAGLGTLFVWLVVQFSYSDASSPVSAAAWGMIADATWVMVLIDAVALLGSLAIAGLGFAFAMTERGAEPGRQLQPRRQPLQFGQGATYRRRRPLD